MKRISPSQEIDLQQLQKGNEQVLAILMKKHFQGLFNYAAKFTSDHELLKDCIQEVFIDLWQRRNNVHSIHSLNFYLLKAVKNKVFKALHHHNYKMYQLSDVYEFYLEYSTEHKLILQQYSQERSVKLKKIIEGLSPRQKEIIYLRFYEHLDNKQIAQIININQQSVYNLLSDTLQKLRTAWKESVMLKAVSLLPAISSLLPIF